MKYARVEHERRFLVEELPSSIDATVFDRLDDLYIRGTHLRLRQVHRPNGDWVRTKLGHKVVDPAAPDEPRARQMTTIYLPESEAAVLAALPGLRTTKRRYKLQEQGTTFSIDVWEHPARGLILSEVEAPSLEELARIAVPSWAAREVTDDPAYTAIRIAGRSNVT